MFPEAYLETLYWVYSDHHPILLQCEGLPMVRGPKPFHFDITWTLHDSYDDVVNQAWDSGEESIASKLHSVRLKSLEFNKNMLGNIFQKKRSLENRLAGVQEKLERVIQLSWLFLSGNCKGNILKFLDKKSCIGSEN